MKTIAVIGLGKVGMSYAAAFAKCDVNVVGHDINPQRTEILDNPENASAAIFDSELETTLQHVAPRLTANTSLRSTIMSTDGAFIVVPTPSLPDGNFSDHFVTDLLSDIGVVLREHPAKYLINLVSTVSPGSIITRLVPKLEKASRMKCGRGFGFCYTPALIALGSVIQDVINPDFAFVGEVDREGADRLEEFYRSTLSKDTPIHRMSAESVEIAKIALNNYLTFKICFANVLGQLCGETSGANVDRITEALGSDHRIGPAFLRAGMGFGGPCLPRDNSAFSACLRKVGLPTEIPDAISSANSLHTDYILRKIGHIAGRKIAVVGLGYKPKSIVTTDSAAIDLCNKLVERGALLLAFDWLVEDMDLSKLDTRVARTNQPTALSEVDMAILTDEESIIDTMHLHSVHNIVTICGSGVFRFVNQKNGLNHT